MDVTSYYRALFHRAVNDTASAIGWKITPILPIIVSFIVWVVTMVLYSRYEQDSNVFAHWTWYVSRAKVLLFIAVFIFAVCLLIAPYRLARSSHDKFHTEIDALKSSVDTLARELDDRRLQEEKADEYGELLDKGRKYLVKWVDGVRKVDDSIVVKNRDLSFEWLEDVRSRLQHDFGRAVSSRVNLGKPTDAIIGISEPKEHEARLVQLDTLIREMRAGTLHLSVARAS